MMLYPHAMKRTMVKMIQKAFHIIFALALLTVSEIFAASEQKEKEKEKLSCN
jgi:hypothetical protein